MKTKIVKFIAIYFCFSTLLFAQMEWGYELLPCPGGIPNCLYIDKKTEGVYLGCYGGVWKLNQTTNQWAHVDDGIQDSSILANANITAMCLDKTGVFYVGCDSNTPSYISYNSGKTWQQIQDFNFTLQQINCIAEHANGTVFLGTNKKILKTADHGRTWTNLENSPTGINAIAVDSSGNLYAAALNGVYKSSDEGLTWVRKSNGMQSVMMTSIAVNSKGIIWVGSYNDVYRSDDSGENWISTRSIQKGGYIFDLRVGNNDIVYVACQLTLNRSYLNFTKDNGSTWIPLPVASRISYYVQLVVNSNDELFCRPYNQNIVKWYQNPTEVINGPDMPLKYTLSQNYPNPFNPSTTIKFSIPAIETRYSASLHVWLKIYDVLGREISTLVNEEKAPGNYEVKFDGTNIPSGVYFYTLNTNGFSQSKKMLLMK